VPVTDILGILDLPSTNQVWWLMPIITALGRPRKEGYKFEINLDNIGGLMSAWAT
jgi:hypothetical protein